MSCLAADILMYLRLAPAQAILKEEERKEDARVALADAVSQKDLHALLRQLVRFFFTCETWQ